MPSLSFNVVANYASFAYATAISLAFMPLLHQTLGPEFFGLIGIYILLTNILSLLDLGLVATVSRECAVHRNNPASAGTLPHTIRGTGLFMHTAGVLLAVAFLALPETITLQWLSTELPPESTRFYLLLILSTILIRWISGLYRGVINGFERQVTTSSVNVLSATLRFPVAYAFILVSDNPTTTYFQLQLAVALAEYLLLFYISRKTTRQLARMPLDPDAAKKLYGRVFKLATSISILMVVTTIYTQIDKIIFSNILPLAQFGDFSLIQTATTGIASLGGPVATALIPRLSNLAANGDSPQVLNGYIRAQQILLAIMLPCGVLCFLLAPRVLFAWTGDIEFSSKMATIFGIYALGNSIWLVSTLPGHLKYASGEINFLLRYNSLLVLLYAPSALFLGLDYGPIGTGLTWLAVNVLALLVGYSVIHRDYFSLQARRKINQEIFLAMSIATALGSVLYALIPETPSRLIAAGQFAACFALVACAVYFSLSACRKFPLAGRFFTKPE